MVVPLEAALERNCAGSHLIGRSGSPNLRIRDTGSAISLGKNSTHLLYVLLATIPFSSLQYCLAEKGTRHES